jgi:hypothetical protein
MYVLETLLNKLEPGGLRCLLTFDSECVRKMNLIDYKVIELPPLGDE